MSAPGNTFLSTMIGLFLVASLFYSGGRLHQWYRTSSDREAAFRDGYDTATQSLFSMATRFASNKMVLPPSPARGAAKVVAHHQRSLVSVPKSGPRHLADDTTDPIVSVSA